MCSQFIGLRAYILEFTCRRTVEGVKVELKQWCENSGLMLG